MKLVTLKVFRTRTEAEMAKNLLKNNDIESLIKAGDTPGLYPPPFSYKLGVELRVNEKDLEKAKIALRKV